MRPNGLTVTGGHWSDPFNRYLIDLCLLSDTMSRNLAQYSGHSGILTVGSSSGKDITELS